MDQATELQGQVAVVTGSSSGVGRAIALELARAGAAVLVHGRSNQRGADEVTNKIRELGGTAHCVMADLAVQEEHEALIAKAWDWQGHVNIWINNAGADVLTGEARNWTFEKKLDHLWRVDVVSAIRLSRLVGQRMVAGNLKNSVILNVGWDQAEHGMAGDSGEMFAAIKGSVMAFTKSLARSLAPQVRVNCLAPGWIKTTWGNGASDYWQDRATKESLLERWGTPEDVAQAARFLASAAAGFITGQTLLINGGFRHRD